MPSVQMIIRSTFQRLEGCLRMSLQELAALETQQAIESANYDNAEVTYAVINEGDLLQVQIVICIQVLVFVWQISK